LFECEATVVLDWLCCHTHIAYSFLVDSRSALKGRALTYKKEDLMENNIVSHIKFTVKDGCVDAFVEAMNKIDKDPLFAALRTFTIQPDEHVFIVTNIYDDIEHVMSIQEKGLAWLDEVEPLLVCAEDGSRKEAWSGPIIFGRSEVTPCAPYGFDD